MSSLRIPSIACIARCARSPSESANSSSSRPGRPAPQVRRDHLLHALLLSDGGTGARGGYRMSRPSQRGRLIAAGSYTRRVSEPIVIPPGGGEVVGDAPDRRVEILSDDDAVNATWSRFGPRRDGADLHVHRRHTDVFYVLEGQLTVRLGPDGEAVAAPAGTLARVPPLVVHGFRNDTDAELRYLNFHAPGRRFADYMRAMRDGRTFVYDQEPPPADGGRPASEAVVGGDGFVAERRGLRVALLADTEDIAIAEARAEPGAPPEPPHVHHRHIECLYVLEGEMALTAGERALRAQAGSWVQVPAGIPHALAAAGAEPLRFLEVHAPGSGFGAYVRALAEAGTDDEAERAGFDRQPAS
jgi:mannose-6-phosphate isomerase-like protein (cupin superfamily)